MESSHLLFLPSPSHPRRLEFTYDKQTPPPAPADPLTCAYPPPVFPAASRVQTHNYTYLRREYSRFLFVHALGKRAVPPVCRRVNLQLAEGGNGEGDAQGGTRDNLNPRGDLFVTRKRPLRRIKLGHRRGVSRLGREAAEVVRKNSNAMRIRSSFIQDAMECNRKDSKQLTLRCKQHHWCSTLNILTYLLSDTPRFKLRLHSGTYRPAIIFSCTTTCI